MQSELHKDLIRLILPEEVFEYFEILKIETEAKQVDIYLDEKLLKPDGYELVKLTSKGFHKTAVIQDFPLRDKTVFLHVRRRRWFSEATGKTVEREWETVAEGTRLTKGFATFLKGLLGQFPHK
jgi:transposase